MLGKGYSKLTLFLKREGILTIEINQITLYLLWRWRWAHFGSSFVGRVCNYFVSLF